MCQAFSCIVARDGRVYWKAGVDSHDEIAQHFSLKDDIAHRDLKDFARVQIIPSKSYLYPRSKWVFQLDESVAPRWWGSSYEANTRKALAQWKKEIYSHIDLKQARNPLSPLSGLAKQPTESDVALLKQWASVRASVWNSVRNSVWDSVGVSVGASVRNSVGDSVGDSVWDSVRDSVRNSVWDSVWAYVGSLFSLPRWDRGYPYQPAVDLWKHGFVSSFDGKVCRLHSGSEAEVVYTMEEVSNAGSRNYSETDYRSR